MGGAHQTVNRHSGIMNCPPCLSLWERWLSEAKTERENQGAMPSQSPSVTALPEGEPRGCTSTREMERICTDTLHSLFHNHPSNVGAVFLLAKKKNMEENLLVAVDRK